MIPAKEFEGELWIKAADFHMQKKEWQGLTDDEIKKLHHIIDWTNAHTYVNFARAIEAKLKEKNNA